jgi:hypothetical protein
VRAVLIPVQPLHLAQESSQLGPREVPPSKIGNSADVVFRGGKRQQSPRVSRGDAQGAGRTAGFLSRTSALLPRVRKAGRPGRQGDRSCRIRGRVREAVRRWIRAWLHTRSAPRRRRARGSRREVASVVDAVARTTRARPASRGPTVLLNSRPDRCDVVGQCSRAEAPRPLPPLRRRTHPRAVRVGRRRDVLRQGELGADVG